MSEIKICPKRLSLEYGYSFDFEKLNVATKYPSILTYHELDGKNNALDSLSEGKSFDGEEVFVTEKIDGTNTRIIAFTNSVGRVSDYLIGSREKIIFAKGDRLILDNDGSLSVAIRYASELLKVDPLIDSPLEPKSIYIFYGEVYGGKITGYKHYSNDGSKEMRFFDVWNMKIKDFSNFIEGHNISAISAWRENGSQPFVEYIEISKTIKYFYSKSLEFKTTPCIELIDGSSIPSGRAEVLEWLKKYKESRAKLTKVNSKFDISEGVIVRTKDRGMIRKIKFSNYRNIEI